MTVVATVISAALVLIAACTVAYVRASEDFDILANVGLVVVAFGNGALFVGVRAGYWALLLAQIAIDAAAVIWLGDRARRRGRS